MSGSLFDIPQEQMDFEEWESSSAGASSHTNTPKQVLTNSTTPVAPLHTSNDLSANARAIKMKLMSPSNTFEADHATHTLGRRQVYEAIWSPPSLNMLCLEKDATWSDDDSKTTRTHRLDATKKAKSADMPNIAMLIDDKKQHHQAEKAQGDDDVQKQRGLEAIEVSEDRERDSQRMMNHTQTYSISDEIENWTEMYDDPAYIAIIECSAATGKNVDKVFEKCIHKVCHHSMFYCL
ncbi:hypothetical protein RFI_26157 [Reticulomyxa filosa]|uniref:Uncharacterized protein n=1 Tax=Reticulomyxa filosa TaxID=46433 RepID=X6MBH1_RETFI|nr:hypothetical protein RFI_26157 [Reticulomyxa filosa]|eukprot:ETO11219.1 hypothetical protein RFI_26157 [Reticulomyxa filosa]